MFVEECKYGVKQEKMPEYITDDIEISSDDSDRKNSDEEISDDKNLLKKILIKKISYRMRLLLYLKHFE